MVVRHIEKGTDIGWSVNAMKIDGAMTLRSCRLLIVPSYRLERGIITNTDNFTLLIPADFQDLDAFKIDCPSTNSLAVSFPRSNLTWTLQSFVLEMSGIFGKQGKQEKCGCTTVMNGITNFHALNTGSLPRRRTTVTSTVIDLR